MTHTTTDAAEARALKACPFCGGKAKRYTIGNDEPNNAGGDVIVCTRCQASSHVEFGRKENLVSTWNNRATAEAASGAGQSAEIWPKQLTPDLRKVLGLMCFQLGRFAHLYQDAGEFVGAGDVLLPYRAEEEQAFMLHKLVGFVLEHGDKWHDALKVDTDRAHKVAAARAKGTA